MQEPTYGIQHVNGALYWRGGNQWTRFPETAKAFPSFDEAETAAMRELPDPRSEWNIRVLLVKR